MWTHTMLPFLPSTFMHAHRSFSTVLSFSCTKVEERWKVESSLSLDMIKADGLVNRAQSSWHLKLSAAPLNPRHFWSYIFYPQSPVSSSVYNPIIRKIEISPFNRDHTQYANRNFFIPFLSSSPLSHISSYMHIELRDSMLLFVVV
mmetsp:Transcript_556/g.1160  ORF Transcript_556/g.1160 Transcript_556/m.1160 type:complete len:146 (-) Transcript_556:2945-3382(-)